MYVVKFAGAGQGVKVLVAEVIVGELTRALGLRVPELVTIDLPPPIAKYEADEEVQDLLNASPGTNLGLDYLPGAFGYDGSRPAEAAEADAIRRQIAEVEASLREAELSGPARESRAATLEMLRLRLEKATTRDGSLAEIQSDLQRVETQIDLALDDAMLRGKPEAISVRARAPSASAS